MTITIPQTLRDNLGHDAAGRAWLATLPELVPAVAARWSLTLGEPFGAEASCSWVAPCTRADGSDAVLKLGWLHMESEDEIQAMRFWNGDPTAYLLEADKAINAMLLERCSPGTVLRMLPLETQDEILAGLLRRLWRPPAEPYIFRPLAEMVDLYIFEAEERSPKWLDPAIARAGIQAYRSLIESTTDHVLLATDLHAGNVLRADREPWLVIDPKPFVGDPAYDATQHLFNCMERLKADPQGTIERFVTLLDLDAERVSLWSFARLATMGSGDPDMNLALARAIAP